MKIPFRTPRAISETSRWTPTPRQGWAFWAMSGLVLIVALLAAGRWGFFCGLFAVAVGTWLAERAVPRKPDLDKELPPSRTG